MNLNHSSRPRAIGCRRWLGRQEFGEPQRCVLGRPVHTRVRRSTSGAQSWENPTCFACGARIQALDAGPARAKKRHDSTAQVAILRHFTPALRRMRARRAVGHKGAALQASWHSSEHARGIVQTKDQGAPPRHVPAPAAAGRSSDARLVRERWRKFFMWQAPSLMFWQFRQRCQ